MTDNACGVLAVILVTICFFVWMAIDSWIDAQQEMQIRKFEHELELLDRSNDNDRT